MRTQPLAKCERNFILQSFLENLRVDGRTCDAYRPIRVAFGREFGSCLVCSGRTKVFARVSGEICPPKPSRPQDGFIYINVEMSPMAAPNFELGRLGDVGIELIRLLEKLIKESQCVDTESLCLKAGEKVWQIRVDVHILDDDGGLADCASIAAVAALAHFRRPDCSIDDQQIIVHGADEKEFVPLNLYHYPLLVSFGLTENGTYLVVDATEREELVLEGSVVIGANKRNELCAVHCSGAVILRKELILKCASRARERVAELTDMIRGEIRKSLDTIDDGSSKGFATDFVSTAVILSNSLVPVGIHCVLPSTSNQKPGVVISPGQISVQNKTAHLHTGDKESTSGSDPKQPPSLMIDRPSDNAVSSTVGDDGDDLEIVDAITAASVDDDVPMDDDGGGFEPRSSPLKRKASAKRRKKTTELSQPANANQDDELADLLDDIEGDVMVLKNADEQNNVGVEDQVIDLTAAVRSKSNRKKKKDRAPV